MNARTSSNVIGLDVGGANLKAVQLHDDQAASCHCIAYPLWQRPDELSSKLTEWIAEIRESRNASKNLTSVLAITMTGELADGYESRREGVQRIIQSCKIAAASLDMRAAFYSTGGLFCNDASEQPWWRLAASNWHASSTLIQRTERPNGRSWMIDMGSTTTDIIPLHELGQLSESSIGRTDFERLKLGTLVYLGVQRTPVTSLIDEIDLCSDDKPVPIMRELFATIDDALVVLGRTSLSDADDHITADGRPRTRGFASRRLARTIGLDVSWDSRDRFQVHDPKGPESSSSLPWILNYAQRVVERAESILTDALQSIRKEDDVYIVGHGATLLDRWLDSRSLANTFLLAEHLGEEITRCFPSYAVAKLLAGETPSEKSGL